MKKLAFVILFSFLFPVLQSVVAASDCGVMAPVYSPFDECNISSSVLFDIDSDNNNALVLRDSESTFIPLTSSLRLAKISSYSRHCKINPIKILLCLKIPPPSSTDTPS